MQINTPARPKPSITADIAPFWAAVKQHRFVLMRCQECGAWYWPAAYCRFHKNAPFFGNMKWEESSGRGKVFAFNVHRRAFNPAFKVPYVLALIELDEGPMFGSNIVGCMPQDVRIGMPVEVTFSDVGDDVILPLFKPSAAGP
jgi:uncharacterized OB-fold protein